MSEEGATNKSSIIAIVVFGFLSMIISQVFTGTSPLWFLGATNWFMILPLYWAQSLLLINLALRYERTSITQLYLWGVIFGLFEGWITKVIWVGYMGETPALGEFLGFAVGEFLIYVLFWHAVFSFVLPILAFQIIVQNTNKGDAAPVETSHLKVIANNTSNKILLGVFTVISSIFVTVGLGSDTLAVLVAAGANFTYLYLLNWFATSWNTKPLNLESLRLGERGLSITIVYLIAIYVVSFFTYSVENLPGIGTILLTIGFYIVVIALIFISPKDTRKTIELPSGIKDFGQVIWAIIMVFMLAITLSLIPVIPEILANFIFLGFVFVGPILFFLAIVFVLRKYRASTMKSVDRDE